MVIKPKVSSTQISVGRKLAEKQLPTYIYVSLSLLWLYSGVVPVLFVPQESIEMLAQLGVTQNYQYFLFYFASLLDVVFGVMILSSFRHSHLLWLAQFVVVVGYSLIVTIGLPENLTHPFAPLIKNIPIMALLYFLYQVHKSKQRI